jgi:hypothetical protein
MEQSGGNADALLHAERVRLEQITRPVGHRHDCEQLLDPMTVDTTERRENLEIPPTAERRIERRPLDHRSDPIDIPDGIVDRVTENGRSARRRPNQAEQHAKRGGLAGTIRSDESAD